MADVAIALAIGLGPLVLLVMAINWAVFSPRKPVVKDGLVIPSGNWSLPIIGESLKFLYSHPDDFTKERQEKYGDEFQSCVEGGPTIFTTTAEGAKFVLATGDKLFRSSYPGNLVEILNHPPLEGPKYSLTTRTVRGALQPDLVAKCVPNIESIIHWIMKSWDDGKEISSSREMTNIMFQTAMTFLCGVPHGSEELKGMLPDFEKYGDGVLAAPLKVPGTKFYNTLRARDRFSARLDEIIERRAKGESPAISYEHNVLDGFLKAPLLDDGTKMSHLDMRNVLIALCFAGHTTSFFLTWLTKYVTENPDVLAALKKEHTAIREGKRSSVEPLTWEDYKTKMPYTQLVILETLRLANVTTLIPRKTIQDVEYKGKLFPKGWKVFVLLRNFHLDAKMWPNPYKFDPSRFKVAPAPGTFMPFGNGSHHCPGSELAKLTASVYLHHLVTKYTWKFAGPDKGTEFWPSPTPIGGMPLTMNKVQVH